MKSLTKPSFLTALCFASGILCLCTQQWLFAAGTDAKGLLKTGHPGGSLSLLLLGICVVLLLLSLPAKDTYCFRTSRLSAVGALFSAVGFAAGSWIFLSAQGQLLHIITGAAGAVSSLCAAAIALKHWQGSKVHTLLHCPSVIFFMFYAVCRYQVWSGESEILRLLFPLLAVLCLILTTYYRSSAAETGKPAKGYLLSSRAGMFCCLAAIAGNAFGILYGTMAVYILLDGFGLKSPEA